MRRSAQRSARFSIAAAAVLAAGGCGFDSHGGSPTPDAPDPTGCYGAGGLPVCVESPPSGAMILSGTLDTDRSDEINPCLAAQPASWAAQPAACFVIADAVTLETLTVTGHRPLVVVAGNHLELSGQLDVASHRPASAAMAVGPGSPSMECNGYARDPVNGPGGGGGAGGSFMSRGGAGGTGDVTNRAGGLPDDAMVGAPGRLRGGCPGQAAAGGATSDGGAAGGAVYLVSGGDIAIDGTINASGAGGVGGVLQDGGNGGGSGGMIVLFGMSITTTSSSVLLALGGGGGGGGAASVALPGTGAGADGTEPQLAAPTTAATGGGGGSHTGADSGGNGGDGGNGFPAADASLDGASGASGAAGGGGGGAAGYIQSNLDLGSATVAPAVHIAS